MRLNLILVFGYWHYEEEKKCSQPKTMANSMHQIRKSERILPFYFHAPIKVRRHCRFFKPISTAVLFRVCVCVFLSITRYAINNQTRKSNNQNQQISFCLLDCWWQKRGRQLKASHFVYNHLHMYVLES